MKTAIIGLPMVGKTSLFTILTGVHEATRVGSMEARVGMTKVPDARLDALAKIFEPPKITHATVEYLGFPGHLQGSSARPQLSGQHARGGRAGARVAACFQAIPCRTRKARWIRCAIWKTWRSS